jgi:hypothetical protein
MKKNLPVAILFAMISFAANAESPCRVALVLNGIVQSWGTSNFTVEINPGDTLHCSVWTGGPCGNCTIDSAATYWIIHGITSHVITIEATDTGVYTLYAQSNSSSLCVNDFNTFQLTINYTIAAVTELTASEDIWITPTLSDGIFKINGAGRNLEQLLITDSMGRIVFITQNNFSEINLSHFSSGIYFYAVTDERKKVWRGRFVKE